MAIRVTCACGNEFEAPEEQAGMNARCPSCGQSLTLPTADTSVQTKEAAKPRAARSPGPIDDAPDDEPKRASQGGTSGKAVAALVLGICSFCLPVLLSIPALIVGILSLSEISKSGGRLKGQALAIIGIVLSILSVGTGIVVLPIALLLPAIQKVREAAARTQSMNNLKQIGLALHMYHDVYGTLPPAALTRDDQGLPCPPYSWRVAILPFVEQESLYRQYNKQEPWDSPANTRILNSMPKLFAHPSRSKPGDTATYYQVLTGKGTMFERQLSLGAIAAGDGTANTFMVVEAGVPVPWTKPGDLTYAPDQPLPQLGDPAAADFNALFADGTARRVQRKTKESTLRALITWNGNEAIPLGETP